MNFYFLIFNVSTLYSDLFNARIFKKYLLNIKNKEKRKRNLFIFKTLLFYCNIHLKSSDFQMFLKLHCVGLL